jgi:putative membrane protein
MSMNDDPARDPRIYMAAERTFLAWIRTGLALMAFGFVVARVGVLMRNGAVAVEAANAAQSDRSMWLGLGLIVTGVITCVASALRNDRYIRAIDRDEFRAAFGSALGVAIVVLLTVIGGAMLVFLARL